MNFYEKDELLQELLKSSLDEELFSWAHEQLFDFGELCATTIDERAAHTDREGQPRLIKYDKFGDDQSYIWLNEGYQNTIKETYGRGIVGYLHKNIPELGRKGNYTYSFAQGYLLSQSEPGFYCPVTLTMATAYLINHYGNEKIKEKYLPHVISTGDTELYEGATFLTERQGGSDVGANETTAIYENGTYKIFGEKYFASNAGACGVATVLARPEGAPKGTKGLSLFVVPWRKDDGNLNGLTIRRLKDKLGVRAVPSGEVVFDGAEAYLIGDKERGFYYMMEALNLSRICNAVASVGIMRRAYTEAFQYAQSRDAFGHSILNYPMVQDTLVKMSVKLEAETVAIFQLGTQYDEWNNKPRGEDKDGHLRLLISLLKAETAETAIHFTHEAIEMHGGNGYIEDFVTPRLLRDAQVLTVWEGTANILGLELLRLFKKWKMDDYFIDYVSKEVALISKDVQFLAASLQNGIQKLKEELDHFQNLEDTEKTRYIKKLQKKMTILYEALLLVKRADGGTSRNKTVANIYIKDQLLPLFGESDQSWTIKEGLEVLNIN